MSTVPPAPQPPAGAPPQKSSGTKVLFWVLGIVLGLIALSFATCAVVGIYAVHKVKQAGFDSDVMKKNPAYAGAKMAATMNPDVELVSSDDKSGTIVLRDKKTGKTTTMKFDSAKNSMVIVDENGKTVTMSTTGEGANGGMEIKSSDGTMKIGASADKAPDWVPSYPGSTPQNTFSASGNGEQTGTFAFTTSDATDKIMSFYSDALKSKGFTVSTMTSNSDGKAGGMVSGDDKADKRTVVVTIGTENDGTHVSVTFNVKQ